MTSIVPVVEGSIDVEIADVCVEIAASDPEVASMVPVVSSPIVEEEIGALDPEVISIPVVDSVEIAVDIVEYEVTPNVFDEVETNPVGSVELLLSPVVEFCVASLEEVNSDVWQEAKLVKRLMTKKILTNL